MRIPPADHLSRFCVTDLHRRCELYRSFRGLLMVRAAPRATDPAAQRGKGR
jgi:hypothetical protein